LLLLSQGCAVYASALAGSHSDAVELRPDDPQALLFCGGKPCESAHAIVTTQRANFPVWLAVTAAEGACLFLAVRQVNRVDSSDAGALATGCGALLVGDVVIAALAVPLQGMFLRSSRQERFDPPVQLRFGATSIPLQPDLLRMSHDGVFDVAKTIAFAREAGSPVLCRALRDPQSGGTFGALPLLYDGVPPKDAAPLVEKLRDQLAQDLAPSHPVGPGTPADLFIEGKLSAGFKLDLRLFDGRSRYVLSSATGSAPTLNALTEQVPRMLNDLYGSCANELLVPARPPARMR
jgi:hypothetical protein